MKKLFIFLIFVLSLAVILRAETTKSPTGVKRAVLVGVGKYVDSRLSPLATTTNDVKDLAIQLEKIGFEPKNIVTLTSAENDPAQRPTARNIQKKIDEAVAACGSDDILFIMLTGHGIERGDYSYFCAEDTELDDIKATGIRIDEKVRSLEVGDAIFKWVVVDACRDSRYFKGLGDNIHLTNPPEGVALLQSCASGERSKELDIHGLFMEQFLAAFQPENSDTNHDGKLSFQEICEYAKRRTQEVSNHFQNPTLDYRGKFQDFDISVDMNRVKAEEAYLLARKLRRDKKYAKAMKAINLALKNFGEDEKYLDERDMIQSRLDTALVRQEAEKKAQEAEKKIQEEREKARELAVQVEAERKKKEAAEAKLRKRQSAGTTLPASSIRMDGGSATGTTLPASLKAGDRKVLKYDGIEYAFRWCPPGEFTMGAPESEWPDRPSYITYNETPHKVKLTRGFWLMETEVTQAMWESVMGSNPSYFKGTSNPVERVSWEDCQEFCRKLSQKLGQQVQLPTEAQWEYACRAGTTGAYAGNLDEMGWYSSNSGSKTHEVGLKKPNAWGLYDMHGNVWEWCLDWYGENYYAESPTSDPTGPNSGSYRVSRGGGWSDSARDCRSASRSRRDPEFRVNLRGFRATLVPVQAD